MLPRKTRILHGTQEQTFLSAGTSVTLSGNEGTAGEGAVRDLYIILGKRPVTFGSTVPPQAWQASRHSPEVTPFAATLFINSLARLETSLRSEHGKAVLSLGNGGMVRGGEACR